LHTRGDCGFTAEDAEKQRNAEDYSKAVDHSLDSALEANLTEVDQQSYSMVTQLQI
jgi:hypothetical protein